MGACRAARKNSCNIRKKRRKRKTERCKMPEITARKEENGVHDALIYFFIVLLHIISLRHHFSLRTSFPRFAVGGAATFKP